MLRPWGREHEEGRSGWGSAVQEIIQHVSQRCSGLPVHLTLLRVHCASIAEGVCLREICTTAACFAFGYLPWAL